MAQLFEFVILKMDKSQAKILQKVPLKSKIIVKSTLSQSSQAMVTRFGYEDSLLAAGFSDGQVRIYNLNTDNKISQIDTNLSKKQITPVNCLRWRPATEQNTLNTVILAANTNGHLFQYVAKTGKQLFHTHEEGNFILSMDYAPNGRTFATAGKDNFIRIYDQQKKVVLSQLTGIKWHTHGHNNRILSLKFKPDDVNLIASGGWDQNINIWDIRQGNSISTLFGPKIAGDSLDFRGDHILSGANRGTDQLQLWDWKTNKVVTKFRWDQTKQQTSAFLFFAQFCHNSTDTIIAAGSNQLKMFSISDGSELLQVQAPPNTSLYTGDSGYTSNRYVMAGNTGVLYHLAGAKSYD